MTRAKSAKGLYSMYIYLRDRVWGRKGESVRNCKGALDCASLPVFADTCVDTLKPALAEKWGRHIRTYILYSKLQ